MLWTTYGIVGPTAGGKTFIAEKLSTTGKFVIINADSQQIYDYLPTLSSMPKNLPENHVLYGIAKHGDDFNVARWAVHAHEEIAKAHTSGKVPVLVGGTGLYFKTLQDGIVSLPEISNDVRTRVADFSLGELHEHVSEDYAARIHDRRRLEKAAAVFIETGKYVEEWHNGPRELRLDGLKLFGLIPERSKVVDNIHARLDRDFDAMIEEVRASDLDDIDMIGYHDLKRLQTRPELYDEVKQLMLYRTRQYAKRQVTYMRNCLQLEETYDCANKLYEKVQQAENDAVNAENPPEF